MEEKKKLKIIIFIALVIIVIITIAYFTNKRNYNKEISDLKENINRLQGEISSASQNTLTVKDIDNTENKNTINNSISQNVLDTKYSEIIEPLQNSDVLFVTDAIDNKNGTYTLRGKIKTEDTSKQQVTEYPYYKETDEYKQITVDSNTQCIYSKDSYEDEIDTVDNVFSSKLYFGGCFNFTFENWKCVSVYEIVTGH